MARKYMSREIQEHYISKKKIVVEKRQKIFEDKLQKAYVDLSTMPPQAGFIYVCMNDAWKNVCKIGCTRDPIQRIKGYGTYDPYDSYKLVGYLLVDDMRQSERDFHKLLSKYRLNGEWFEIPFEKAIGILHNPQKIDFIISKNSSSASRTRMLKITRQTKRIDV